MLQTISKALLAFSTMTLLVACSNTPADAPVAAVAPAAAVAPIFVEYAADPAAAPAGTRVLVASVNVLVTPPQVSESERVAEELRLVDFEQSFAIEMNRRNQEQAARAERAAVAARAGVVQGPGCEGTEGHAAVECEQSLI
ncbi:hypothetical protein [Massilia sp. TSP1-1-2]|uniref:hypothetical protein n=1 Tax=unclassified Massilia TaxID=2609279 RepID=UPI003CF271A3